MNRTVIISLVALLIGLIGGFFVSNYWRIQADENAALIIDEAAEISAAADQLEMRLDEADNLGGGLNPDI